MEQTKEKQIFEQMPVPKAVFTLAISPWGCTENNKEHTRLPRAGWSRARTARRKRKEEHARFLRTRCSRARKWRYLMNIFPYHQSVEIKKHIAQYGTVLESWLPLGVKEAWDFLVEHAFVM